MKLSFWNKIFILAVILPIPIILINIFSGSIPFWFDPARDFLSALSSQHKLTLIGQPTGIPGLFYGPYWVWLLSVPLLFSKDPRVVQLLVLGIPYMLIFPLVLYRFKLIFDLKIITALYLLFAFSFMRYAIFPWNPHLAPLLVLVIIYLLVFKDRTNNKNLLYVFLAGLFSGVVGNFHISFDIGLIGGTLLYFFISFLKKINLENFKRTLIESVLYFFGFLLAFAPFLLFEARHGFYQTKTAITTFLSPYAVVGLKGLTSEEIWNNFLLIPARIIQLPDLYGNLLFVILIIILGWVISRKVGLVEKEKNLLILTLSILVCVLFIFLSSKNPVWEYHFIAAEIPFLLLLGLIMRKLRLAKILFLVWAIVILATSYSNFFIKPRPSVLSYDSLAKKEFIVKLINQDAKGSAYTVFAYNPAIYTYDYSYLFDWLAGKDMSYDPGQIKEREDTVYLIIQKTDPGIFQDYINVHAPDNLYKTTKKWKIADGTVVLKRESLKKQ